jgi:hypothetical protein
MKTSHLVQHCRLRRSLIVTSTALTLAFGCGGENTHELGLTRTQAFQDPSEDEPTEPFYSDADDFVGRWVGEADATLEFELGGDGRLPLYQFPSGSTRFELELQRGSEGSGSALVGSLSFGEGAPLPPPTDPDVGYPPGTNYLALLSYGQESQGLPTNEDQRLPLFESYPYTVSPVVWSIFDEAGDMRDGLVPDGVLSMSFSTAELIDGWCGLQIPVGDDATGYSPIDAPGGYETRGDGTDAACNLFGDYDLSQCPENLEELSGDDRLAVDHCIQQGPVIGQASCDKTFLAGQCACSSSECFARGVFIAEVVSHLMVRRVGDTLVGAFKNAIFPNARNLPVPLGQVRFQRVE